MSGGVAGGPLQEERGGRKHSPEVPMSALRPACILACVLTFALPALADDPPKPAVKPAVKKLYGLHTPGGWMLDIHDDGSGRLGFGASLGDKVPAGTFQ